MLASSFRFRSSPLSSQWGGSGADGFQASCCFHCASSKVSTCTCAWHNLLSFVLPIAIAKSHKPPTARSGLVLPSLLPLRWSYLDLWVLVGADVGDSSGRELILFFCLSFLLVGFRKQKQRLEPKQQREQQEGSWQREGPQVSWQRQRV